MIDQLAHAAIGAVFIALAVLVHPLAGLAFAAAAREVEQGVVRNRLLYGYFDRKAFLDRYRTWKHLRGKLNDWFWYMAGGIACLVLL